ncbi:prepilin-type N-terminal cleavage/methylation domain-containing protein, partial [Candidatus Roizmanbacteria bacterium]|nr:prepilin-type N-terminal cleavage/methylation domain-containing protein [Candidatus Roizmanbacteria bacterium]
PLPSTLYPDNGYSLVEIIISIAVFSVVLFAAIAVFSVAQDTARIGHAKTKANLYMRDYIEKVKNIRRNDWDSLINGRYLFVETTGNLEMQSTVDGETIGNYSVFLDIEDAYRDTDGNILDAPGLVDPSTKKITVTVSWTGLRPGTISESMYLTRYMDNLAWIQTTQAHFTAGTHTGTTVLATNGDPIDGEIVLGAGGSADWCSPELTLEQLDLPKNGVAKALTAIEGKAFAGTGENASGESFVVISISDTDPPDGTFNPATDVFNGYKTNDVFGEENYGYIVTDTNSSELVIINLSTSQVTEFNIPGNTDGLSVFVSGNTAFVTAADSKLYAVNVTNKTSPTILDADGVAMSGTGTSVVVAGDYAYVSIAGNSSRELEIIDVSDPSNLQVVGWADVNGGSARDVFINQTATRAYLVNDLSLSAGVHEFFIIDIDAIPPSGNRNVVGSVDTGSMSPKAIEIVPGGRAIIVGTGGKEYQVFNITNESSLASCVDGGGIDVDSGIYDSASVIESDNDAYTYIVTGDASSEFKIIEGGPGGNYASSGIFESQTLDTSFNSTGFNRFTVTETEPVGTSVKYQVAAKEPEVGGCAATTFGVFDFVGPTGNSASFFSDGDFIPPDNDDSGYENPSQCFRFRAYLETDDYVRSPTLHDFTLNYSP